MKRILSALFLVLLSINFSGARQLDSLSKASLGGKIDEYFGALAGESLETQKSEADFMIELSIDSLIRQFTAVKIYEHYVNSPLMGAENVAVHVFDRWFSGGDVKMDSDIDFLNARIYADFNRMSLIGEKAPELVMKRMDGSEEVLFAPDMAGDRYSVLFFYDAGCVKCRLESILLKDMLAGDEFPIDFYAIYAGDGRDAWETYVNERFDVEPEQAELIHLWDPELDSDFQRKYGVIQTPRMFLVSPEGIIVGRGLDTKALSEMLHAIFDEVYLEYGSDESVKLFDGIFTGGENTADDVRRIADYIESSTLGQNNPLMFRQLTGDFLYYLSSKSGEAFKEGSAYLIADKILSRPDIWKTADDSLKVIGLARFMDGLLDKARPGSEIASLDVPAERIRSGKSKSGNFRLDRLRGNRNIIIFYTEGCGNCEAEKAAARELALNDRRIRVLLVNVDEIISSSPALGNRLFETFDLSVLPFIIETDKKGNITRRYVTLR